MEGVEKRVKLKREALVEIEDRHVGGRDQCVCIANAAQSIQAQSLGQERDA